jgi:hypothetical protein
MELGKAGLAMIDLDFTVSTDMDAGRCRLPGNTVTEINCHAAVPASDSSGTNNHRQRRQDSKLSTG